MLSRWRVSSVEDVVHSAYLVIFQQNTGNPTNLLIAELITFILKGH